MCKQKEGMHVCYIGYELKLKRYWFRIPAGSDICARGCAWRVLQNVPKPVVCNAVYMILCTIENPSSHSISVGHSPDLRVHSVAIWPWFFRKRCKAIFNHIHLAIYPDDIARLLQSDRHLLAAWFYCDHQRALAAYSLHPSQSAR